jgi:energy-coupling factor transporter transmembrane protein EcfT
MFVVSKSAVAISAVNLAIYALRVIREIQARTYALAVVSIGSTLPMIFHLLFTTYQCRKKGENLWRDSATSTTEPTGKQLKAAGSCFGEWAVLVCADVVGYEEQHVCVKPEFAVICQGRPQLLRLEAGREREG